MARLVYALNVSLDGFVDHQRFEPDPVLFGHWTEHVRALAGSLYGRRMYEVMRYWDDDHSDWGPAERDFADAWRRQPKWVVSQTLASVGANATLLAEDVAAAVRALKDQVDGEIQVGGPVLAQSLTEAGLVDEYRLYLLPVVPGGSTRFFAGPRPPLRLAGSDRIGRALRLSYVPA